MNTKIEEVLQYCSHKELLYIEDNDSAREFTMELLSRFFKKITLAKNGLEGLKVLQTKKIDIIISDVNMPKMDGITMSAEIKKTDKNLPIILLSAHNEINFKADAKEIGINYYLEKPLNLAKLLELFAAFIKTDKGKRLWKRCFKSVWNTLKSWKFFM